MLNRVYSIHLDLEAWERHLVCLMGPCYPVVLLVGDLAFWQNWQFCFHGAFRHIVEIALQPGLLLKV